MRIVVMGGRGHVGSRLVSVLRANGHEVVAASRASGVDAVTGEGLAEALAGAHVLVDVMESPSLEQRALLDFFATSSRSLLAAEAAAGVRHHIALSVVGVDRVNDSGYFRAKAAQEALIRASSVPYTIVRSTQFFDLIERILRAGIDGDVVRVAPALMQPIDADDVAEALAEIAVAPPLNGTIELAGSETICLNELARLVLSAQEDPRRVIADADAPFFGAVLGERSLIADAQPQIGSGTLRDWLRHFITPD
jgi:uncharacterized protein YbjT (DUF2867 family)